MTCFNGKLLLSDLNFLLLPKPVNGAVTVTLSTDEAAESESGELAGVNAISIKVPDVDLDSGVILGGDEPVCGGTLPGDIEIHVLTLLVLHLG